MILRRLGNKKAIAHKIIPHFPPHRVFIETFFGAGGMFFQKPKAKYNIVNDLDSDVFNLFQVVMNQKEELEKAFYMMPIHSDLLDYWKNNDEVEPVRKALRFLFLSNLTLLGKGSNIRHSVSSGAGGGKDFKDNFNSNLELTFRYLHDVNFANFDFRKFLNALSFAKDGRNDEAKTFIYNDPPYQNTGDNYSNSFTKQDLIDLIEVNLNTGCKFAISEFDTDIVLELAAKYNLEVIEIGERQALKSRSTEILCVNYESPELYGLFGRNNLNL
jgi:DNA adenine methylase